MGVKFERRNVPNSKETIDLKPSKIVTMPHRVFRRICKIDESLQSLIGE